MTEGRVCSVAACCSCGAAPSQGILSAATSDLLELAPGVGATARVLVGTGRYHDPVITDGWSGYQHERNQVCSQRRPCEPHLQVAPHSACQVGTVPMPSIQWKCSTLLNRVAAESAADGPAQWAFQRLASTWRVMLLF